MCGFSFFGSWNLTRWNKWWLSTSWVLFKYKGYTVSSFPDSRRSQVEACLVTLDLQSCEVYALKKWVWFTAFWCDFFFFFHKNSEKELELSVAASGALDPEKKVRSLDFFFSTYIDFFLIICTLWVLIHKTIGLL